MKRVICFDLWGTLVESPVRQTYEDYLVQYWPRELIQKTVRDLLMTDAWCGHALAEHDGKGILRPDHVRTAAMLLVDAFGFLPHMGCTTPSMTTFAHLLMETARRWKWENEQVKWIPGAQEVVESLKTGGDTLALVTNTTSYGDAMVDRTLEINRPRGRFFTTVFNSCAHPFAKPDRRVWEWIVGRNPNADEYWMIGNDPVIDIAVPKAMGWKTILVNHPDGVSISKVPKIITEAKGSTLSTTLGSFSTFPELSFSTRTSSPSESAHGMAGGASIRQPHGSSSLETAQTRFGVVSMRCGSRSGTLTRWLQRGFGGRVSRQVRSWENSCQSAHST